MSKAYKTSSFAQYEYHCLMCNEVHVDTDPIYDEHITLHKGKDGLKHHKHKWSVTEKGRNGMAWYGCVCGASELK